MRYSILIILLLLICLFMTSCEIKKFVMPTWDVTLNVPLLNEKYFVSDLIDSVYFFPAPDNNVIFQSSGELDTEPYGDISIPMDVDTGELPLQSQIELTDSFPLSNLQTGAEVAYGLISEGRLRVTFSGMHTSVDQVTLTLINIVNDVGSPLTIEYGGGNGGYFLPLDGYHVGVAQSDVIVQDVNFTVTVQSSEPLGVNVGYIRLGITDDLNFSIYRGRIPSLTMDIIDNQSHIDVDYPWGIENAIQLQEAKINLYIENPISFPFEIFGDFYAVNHNSGLSATISIVDDNGNPFKINPKVGDLPGITDIEFSNNVGQLLRIMPDYIELRNSSFRLDNSTAVVGEIKSTDMIAGNYIANSPFKFTLLPALITPKDSIEIEISKDNRDIIKKNINSASMLLGIVNQLPIGAQVNLYFSTNPLIIPENPASWAFSHNAHIAAKSEPNLEQFVPIELSHEEILLFSNQTVYMKQTFMFDASEEVITITASPSDYIQLRSMIRIDAHMED